MNFKNLLFIHISRITVLFLIFNGYTITKVFGQTTKTTIMTQNKFLKKAKQINLQIKQRITEDNKNKVKVPDNVNKKEIITYKEVDKKFKTEHYREPGDMMLVIYGDVYVKGDVNDAWFNKQLENMTWKGKLYGVLITGSLFVDGDIIDDNYLMLHVIKNVSCDYIFSYNGHQVIHGDLRAKFGIYGEYNDGYLHVSGKIFTPYIIADDHDMSREAEGDFIYIEGGNETEKEDILIGHKTGSAIGWDWDYYENSAKLFVPGVWDENNTFSVAKFFNIVRKGDNPFIPSIK